MQLAWTSDGTQLAGAGMYVRTHIVIGGVLAHTYISHRRFSFHTYTQGVMVQCYLVSWFDECWHGMKWKPFF